MPFTSSHFFTGVVFANLNGSSLLESNEANPYGTGTKSLKVIAGLPASGTSYLAVKMFQQKLVEDKGKYFFGIWVKVEDPGASGAILQLGWTNKNANNQAFSNYSADYTLTDSNWHFLVQATDFATVSEFSKMQPIVRFKSANTVYLDDPIVYMGVVL